ncbi:hypothetical protein BsWGS_26777 [Bradybaena similaris]
MKLCRLGYHVVFFQCTLAVYLSDLVNKPLNRLATYYKQDVEQRHNNWIFNPRVARNVILLLVEGLDSHTMSVARQVLETQTSTVNNYITAVDFFLSGQLKPASRDFIVADPAAAVSAIFNGLPEYNGQMGWVEQGEASCLTFDRSKKLLKNLFKVMSEAGKMTGLVTTTRLTSPGVAGAFAATPDMQMESDIHLAEAGCNDGKFKDIAAQLIKDYKDLNIIIGQGREYFMKPSNRSSNSSVYPWRRDLDLKTYWAMEKLLRKKTYREAVGTKAVKDALRGQDNLQYFLGFLDEVQSSPASDDLQDLVSLVVNVLNGKPNNNGYFLTIYDDQLARDHENDAYNVGTDLNNILKAVNYLDEAHSLTPATLSCPRSATQKAVDHVTTARVEQTAKTRLGAQTCPYFPAALGPKPSLGSTTWHTCTTLSSTPPVWGRKPAPSGIIASLPPPRGPRPPARPPTPTPRGVLSPPAPPPGAPRSRPQSGPGFPNPCPISPATPTVPWGCPTISTTQYPTQSLSRTNQCPSEARTLIPTPIKFQREALLLAQTLFPLQAQT